MFYLDSQVAVLLATPAGYYYLVLFLLAVYNFVCFGTFLFGSIYLAGPLLVNPSMMGLMGGMQTAEDIRRSEWIERDPTKHPMDYVNQTSNARGNGLNAAPGSGMADYLEHMKTDRFKQKYNSKMGKDK